MPIQLTQPGQEDIWASTEEAVAHYEHMYRILEIMLKVQPQEGGARPSPGQRHQDYRELYGRARAQHPHMLGLPLRVAVRGIPITGCPGAQRAGI